MADYFQIDQPLVTSANYRSDVPPIYAGNPFIEALPRYENADHIIELLRNKPPYDPAWRELEDAERLYSLASLKEVFEPQDRDIERFHEIISQMMACYYGRVMADPAYFLKVGQKQSESSPIIATNRPESYDPPVLHLAGLSGSGKSKSYGRWLSAIPQAIRHSQYHGHQFTVTQVPWVMLECPSNGSPKALVKRFFRYLDGILDTRYHDRFARNLRDNADEKLGELSNICALHGVAIVVIDNSENLSKAKSGGGGLLNNFFFELTRNLRALVILVSTYESVPSFLLESFRDLRRGTELGTIFWERYQGDEWDYYIQALWEYQYTRDITPLDEALSQVMFYETQGIPALATALYQLVQERAITIGAREGHEKITPTLIRSVALDRFGLLREPLQALRQGTRESKIRWPDLGLFLKDLQLPEEQSPDHSDKQAAANNAIDETAKDHQGTSSTPDKKAGGKKRDQKALAMGYEGLKESGMIADDDMFEDAACN